MTYESGVLEDTMHHVAVIMKCEWHTLSGGYVRRTTAAVKTFIEG